VIWICRRDCPFPPSICRRTGDRNNYPPDEDGDDDDDNDSTFYPLEDDAASLPNDSVNDDDDDEQADDVSLGLNPPLLAGPIPGVDEMIVTMKLTK
jgi:hypothetical protein